MAIEYISTRLNSHFYEKAFQTLKMNPSRMREIEIHHTDCQEKLLPTQIDAGYFLREKGISKAGISHFTTEYLVSRPDPSFHNLVFSLEGVGQVTFSQRTEILEQGDLLIVPKGVPNIKTLGGDYWKILWFQLQDNEGWTRLIQTKCLKKSTRADVILQTINHYIREASLICRDLNLLRLHAETLFSCLRNEIQTDCLSKDMALKNEFDNLWLQINQSLNRKWTVQDMACSLGYTPRYVIQKNNEFYGMPPMKLLTNFRIEKVKSLLHSQNSYTLIDIADIVGYTDAYNLSSAFKRVCGISPKYYREQFFQ